MIADVDWGFLLTHEDLRANIERRHFFNSYDGSRHLDTSSPDYTQHGTAALGLAAAALNGVGVVGFAYQARLWPIQAGIGIGGSCGNPWARGLRAVALADSGGRRRVVILEIQTPSGGNAEESPALRAAIAFGIRMGVVVCLAAGNRRPAGRDVSLDDHNRFIPPSGAILVGATQKDDQNSRASWSNFGSRVAASAPGVRLDDWTCNGDGDRSYFAQFGGTSGAVAKVAGACALLLDVNERLSHADVAGILRRTGGKVTTPPSKPAGSFLNCEAAVLAAHEASLGD